MFSILIPLFAIVDLAVSFDNITTIETATKRTEADDYILCRGCGTVISSSNYIIYKESPSRQYAIEDTIFSRRNVLVQVLRNELNFNFAVITTEHSSCVRFGQWETSDLWFPGYRWKACLCPDCGVVVGWVFEPVEYNSVIQQNNPFFGLILTSLIGESCKYIFLLRLCKFSVSSLLQSVYSHYTFIGIPFFVTVLF